MKVVSLSGFACNGKSSLLSALKWELERTGKKVITLSEPVSIPLSINEILNDEDKFLCNYQIQTPILSSAIHQLEFLKELNKISYDGYVIMDRSIIDVLVFTAIKQKKLRNVNIQWIEGWLFGLISDIVEILRDLNLNRYFPHKISFIRIPNNVEIISKCFERKERNITISYNSFFEDAELFEYLFTYTINTLNDGEDYIDFCGIDYKKFQSPIDNPYTLYKILEWVIE